MKRYYSWMLPFILYSLIVFLLMTAAVCIPSSSDLLWVWGFLFYLPYIYFGIYIMGFILGLSVQKRSNAKTVKVPFMLSLTAFLITLSNLLIPAWKSIASYSLYRNLIYTIYPAMGSSVLFFIAQIIKLHRQKSVIK